MASWQIQLGGKWTDLPEDVCKRLYTNDSSITVAMGGNKYRYDMVAMTQTNLVTGKSRPIRHRADSLSSMLRGVEQSLPRSVSSVLHRSESSAPSSAICIQVWLAGEWKKESCPEAVQHIEAGDTKFRYKRKEIEYEMNMDAMTQTNLKTGRTRIIRFAPQDEAQAGDFDLFRSEFKKILSSGSMTEDVLKSSWPGTEHGELLPATVKQIMKEMNLRGKSAVDIMEWIHFWSLQNDTSTSYHASMELNDKIKQALKVDAQVLGRMQMHFENAAQEEHSSHLTLNCFRHACERLAREPKNVLEKKWAQETLLKIEQGDIEDDLELSYYDFLNVMLGRKRFPITLYMYDISNGLAKQWSWLLLGQSFEGIWHTGVVVEWPGQSVEFWFGGQIFQSRPATTPFGQPVHRRVIGYTYKLREEACQYIGRNLCSEFTRDNYDVITHNCNHFSDKFMMFLNHEHIPDEVLKLPEMVMETITVKMLRPLLNSWLGGFSGEGHVADHSPEMSRMWDQIKSGTILEFSMEEGSRPLIGQVITKTDVCVVQRLDFWNGCPVEVHVPPKLVNRIVGAHRLGL